MQLLILSGSLSDSSQSHVMASRAEGYAQSHGDVTLIDPRDLDLQFCDGRAWDRYNSDVTQLQEEVQRADCYLFAVPVYNWSYSGVFKNMIDLIPPGGFGGNVAGFMGKGGAHRGFLMLQREMRSLMSYFNVHTVPEVVYASNADFDGEELGSQEIDERIEKLVRTVFDTAERLEER